MRCSDSILLSGINPFDRSYHRLQQIFDERIIEVITGILQLNGSLVRTPLITDFGLYEKNPDNWVVEQIINGTAELSSSTVVLSSESARSVAYSFGIAPFRPQLYYKARSLREENNIYLLPFSSELWICLIITAVLLIAVLTFILNREAKLPHEISYDVFARIIDVQQDRDEECTQHLKSTSKEVLLQKEKWEMGEILLVCLGAQCQQGSARDPSTNAARIVILCMFGWAVVGYTAYSASLISFVSLFPSTQREEMRNVAYLAYENDILLHGIYNPKNLHLHFKETEFTDLEKGFQKTLQGKAVFVGDRDISLTFLHQQKYTTSNRCTLGRIFLGVEYQKVLVLKKNSKYKEKINHNILQLKQYGLLNRERKRIFNTESPCSFNEKLSTSNFVSFNKQDMKPVLNLYLLGVFISFLLLIVENIFHLCPRIKKTSRLSLQLT